MNSRQQQKKPIQPQIIRSIPLCPTAETLLFHATCQRSLATIVSRKTEQTALLPNPFIRLPIMVCGLRTHRQENDAPTFFVALSDACDATTEDMIYKQKSLHRTALIRTDRFALGGGHSEQLMKACLNQSTTLLFVSLTLGQCCTE